MGDSKSRKEREFKIIAILGIAFAAFTIWLSFTEFYTIALLQETSGYPFGGEGPTPWYYKSSDLYATYHLSVGLGFLLIALLLLWGLIKRSRAMVFITFGVSLLLFMVLQATAQ